MRTPAKANRPKPRISQNFSYPAPTRGWISNENLANATEGGAAVLENWTPLATGVRVRAGSQKYVALAPLGDPIRSLFTYLDGGREKIFASNDANIVDISAIGNTDDIYLVGDQNDEMVTENGDFIAWEGDHGVPVYFAQTDGDWHVVQFATAGGTFLVGVNGVDEAFLYDGTLFYSLGTGGITTLAYDGGTMPFEDGEVVTGGTSGATGTIARIVGDDIILGGDVSGTMILKDVTGDFENDEVLTGGLVGAAVAAGPSIPIAGAFGGVATSSLSFVWVYKQRLWFVEKNSLNAWYLPVDQISGTAVKFPLGGIFGRGGSLLFGATWSLDSGAEGGLSEQCIFVSTEGEIAVYQGTDPSNASTWSKVGVYRIGRPLGRKAFSRLGGDLAIATDIGLIPLSQAIRRDIAALGPAAVSYPIEVAWNDRVAKRSSIPWHCEIWPTRQIYLVSLPTLGEERPEMLVANTRTGAWTVYTGWDGTCLAAFKERLFFGTPDGFVVEAGVSGYDLGKPYTATCVPLFSDFGQPGIVKTSGMGRAVLLSPFDVKERVTLHTDFVVRLPPAPDATSVAGGSFWDLARWDEAVWGQAQPTQAHQKWRSVSGAGYAMAPAVQLTWGAVAPPNVDLIRLEVTWQQGDVGT